MDRIGKIRRFGLLLAGLLIGATGAAAQEQQQQQDPCAAPEMRQFDFWVGEWELTWQIRANPQPGEQEDRWVEGAGTDRVERVVDGCAVLQHFDGAPAIPLRGASLSLYDRRAGKWRQVWVDNSGGWLDFEGGFADGRMVLSREAVVGGQRRLQRMTYYNIARDSFDWDWEVSTDGGQTWRLQWRIHYKRKS